MKLLYYTIGTKGEYCPVILDTDQFTDGNGKSRINDAIIIGKVEITEEEWSQATSGDPKAYKDVIDKYPPPPLCESHND